MKKHDKSPQRKTEVVSENPCSHQIPEPTTIPSPVDEQKDNQKKTFTRIIEGSSKLSSFRRRPEAAREL